MSQPKVPRKYADDWQRPWTLKARRSRGFRLWLGRNGYLTPHFTKAEAASKDGKAIPLRMLSRARAHAFRLEVVRHELGDKPMVVRSWYRSPARNRQVGGAAKSKHMEAIATDHPAEYVAKHPRFDKVCERVFRDGGFGQYPGGARHCDSRGYKARWTTFTPGR